MKKLLVPSAIACIIITLFSCKENADSNNAMLNQYKKVYSFSMTYHDYINAENAIYQQMALDTPNTLSYKDTLVNLYYRAGQFVQAAILGKEILSKKPDDMIMMEMVSDADKNINNLGEALNYNQIIYTKLHDLYHLYQIALIQFSLTRMAECNQTIDQILADSGATHQQIALSGAQGLTQNVPYKAAALNIRGVIAKALNQKDVAKKTFEDALAVDTAFVLAKNNLKDLNK